MTTSKSIIETTKLMLSIANYCEKNNLLIWGEKLRNLMKIYLGSQTEFDNYKMGADFPVFQLNTENIEGFNFDLALDASKDNSNCCIFPHQVYDLDHGKTHAEIFVHAFWENSKEIMKRFSNHWVVGSQFDFNHAMRYKTDTYPKGFADNNLIAYSLNTNWIHLLDILQDSTVDEFFENHKKMEEFHHSLIEMKKSAPLIAYSIIRNLLKKIAISRLSEDASIHLSHILMDILPENLQEHYTEQFPFMKILMEDKHKETLFIQSKNEIIEKLVLPKFEIFAAFKNADLTAKQLMDFSINILSELGRNEELKSKGLKALNFDNIKEIACFLTFTNNEVINNHELARIFVECMTNCLCNKQVLLDSSHNGINNYNVSYIEQVTKTTVSHYLLNKEVANNKIVEPRKNKI